jgi:hypothetical protein
MRAAVGAFWRVDGLGTKARAVAGAVALAGYDTEEGGIYWIRDIEVVASDATTEVSTAEPRKAGGMYRAVDGVDPERGSGAA